MALRITGLGFRISFGSRLSDFRLRAVAESIESKPDSVKIPLAKFRSWLSPHPPLRRYRVTPRRKPAVFRREILAGVIHHLRRDSTRATYG